jgi:hypothetical protein
MSQTFDPDTHNSPYRPHQTTSGGRRTAQETIFQTRNPTDPTIPDYRNLLPEPASHTHVQLVSYTLPTGIHTSHTQASPTTGGEHGQRHHTQSENGTTLGGIHTSCLKTSSRYHIIHRPPVTKRILKGQIQAQTTPKSASGQPFYTQTAKCKDRR